MLAAEYVAHFVSGMQGDKADPLFDGKWAKAIATCKHYDAYSLENFNNQAAAAAPAPVCSGPDCDRTHFNAIVSDQELAETYLPAFTRGCVAGGGTRSIMCSYNAGVKVRGPLSLCLPACPDPAGRDRLRCTRSKRSALMVYKSFAAPFDIHTLV
jgi:beta-glucosidase-like glycosyl hydrolase